jgi:hypothetical protein
MGREDLPNGYLLPSTAQRRPKGGITRFNTGVFGADTELLPPRTTTLAGRVRDAIGREVREVLDGYEHQPADAPKERPFEIADTGPEGLGVPPSSGARESGQGSRRKKSPNSRDRDQRSPHGQGNGHERGFGRRNSW